MPVPWVGFKCNVVGSAYCETICGLVTMFYGDMNMIALSIEAKCQ